jgi:general secretion pathway protein L
MLFRAFAKKRPKHLLGVYVEPRRIEIVRAHRHWRSWHVENTEGFSIPEGEGVHDYLQRLNLRPRGKRSTALVLFLPRIYYSFHKEYYPTNLQEHLQEVMDFDWPENIFYEHERTLHFSGPPVAGTYNSVVPIFSMQRQVYDKFYQILGAEGFGSFTVIPSSLAYATMISSSPDSGQSVATHEFIGRMVEPSRLEVHRFHGGFLVDSLLLGKDLSTLTLFHETLNCIQDGESEENSNLQIQLFCSNGECHEDYGKQWKEENLPITTHPLNGSLLSLWVKSLLEEDQIQNFDAPLHLKPWRIPKIIFPLLAIIGLYSLFAFHQIHKTTKLVQFSAELKAEKSRLETQWKPIEQLQSRITQLQEDHKSLAQFNEEGYPVLEMLELLTEITPDDTWLNYFSLKKGRLTLRGESKSAIKYLSELSNVEGFEEAKFASPVQRLPKSDKERLVVNLKINPKKLKVALEKTRKARNIDEESEAKVQDNSTASRMERQQKRSSMRKVKDEGTQS